ncbi:FMN-dependent NADH-azoreductase [Cnuibacter sp. UC19_7]|uniref:FMN-dependent NADH-azoreductase n=1 Tax=Cnuibacter sp. UC19_7 TaxID=3350166 RepID=UPI0036714F04
MAVLLHLDSSSDDTGSRSRSIGKEFADAWLAAAPGNEVVHRDLHRDPLPHLADASLHWPPRLRGEGARPPADAEALQGSLIEELLAADAVLVDAPMYNYSMPSALKAWIDHIHVPGVTAPFDVPSQPLAGRPAVIVSTRGGSYDAGSPTEGWDHVVPPLTLILSEALGMTVTVIRADLTLAESVPALAEEIPRSRQEHADALAAARSLGSTLGAASL